jgi:hypothetical protein
MRWKKHQNEEIIKSGTQTFYFIDFNAEKSER